MEQRQLIRVQFVASAAMEISWLFSWASLIMRLLADRLFPYPQAIAVFSLAAVLASVTGRRGWRRIWKIVLHTFGFVPVSLLLLHAFIYPSTPLLSRTWVTALLALPETAIDWFILVLMVIWSLVFWVSGLKLAWRPTVYWSVCRRFDLGILMFAGLFLFKLGLIHNGAPVVDQATGSMVMIFLFFGLLAIGLARNRQQARTTYLAGRHMVGTLVTFVIVILMFAVGLTALAWPYFVATAELGYDLLQQGFKPIGSMLVWILRVIFRGGMKSTNSAESFHDTSVAATLDSAGSAAGTGLFVTILWWAGAILLVAALTGLAGFMLWRLVRWLLAKSPGGREKTLHSPGFIAWLAGLPGILMFCLDWVRHRLRRNTDVRQIYRDLLCWGKYSGITHSPGETPREYGLRLGRCFPTAQGDIALITDLFQRVAYAEQMLDSNQFKRADQAMHRLRRPSYWPARLLSRLRISGGDCCGNPERW